MFPVSDSHKLRLLAEWLDQYDDMMYEFTNTPRHRREVQVDLKRIAERLEKLDGMQE